VTAAERATTDRWLDAALEGIGRVLERRLDDLGAMLACDTSFPPGAGYGAFADLMERILTPKGFEATRIEVPRDLWDDGTGTAAGARVNLIAARPGRRVDPCSIYFHVDTVPPGDGWTRPALALTREEGRLYGRGAADMKGAIAAVLAALDCLAEAGIALRHEPVLLFCTDEEGGLYPGIRYLAETGRVEGHLLSFNGGAAPRIWAGCFGSLDLAIEIEGRAAHSATPERGINAVEAALPVMEALTALARQVAGRASALPPPPGAGPLHPHLTIAGVQAGGTKGSAVPGACRIVVNRRYAPEEEAEAVTQELRRTVETALAGTGATGHRLHVLGHLAPVTDPTGPHWPRWQAALARGFGWNARDFARWGATSASDMGWVQQAGIGEILLGGLARPERNIHGADEHTTLDDLRGLARSVTLYLAAPFHPGAANDHDQGEQGP